MQKHSSAKTKRHVLENELGNTKTDVVIKLVLVFFISLLSFSIGTFVGKKFSDNQHKISHYEPTSSEHGSEANNEEEHDRSVASVPTGPNEVKPGKSLSDSEIAKLAEEFVTDDEGHGAEKNEHGVKTDKNSAHQLEAHASPAEEKHGKDKKSEDHGADHKANNEKPLSQAEKIAKDEHSVRVPSSVDEKAGEESGHGEKHGESTEKKTTALPKNLMTEAAGKFTVQIAAYPTEAEAEKLAADLKLKGFSSFYVNAKTPDKKVWYRVSVGLFSTSKEAENYLKDLKARGKITSAFVQKIAN